MQMTSNGQVQRSAAEWSNIIARYRQSGLGSRQFCEQEGLTRRTFEKWYGRLRRSETSKGKFVEVTSPPTCHCIANISGSSRPGFG